MYAKKVLIFNESDGRFSESGKALCGMTKLLYEGGERTKVTVFVTNANASCGGEWWIIVTVGTNCYAHLLDTFNNCQFEIPETELANVGCVLVNKVGENCTAVCQSYLKNPSVNASAVKNAAEIISGGVKISADSETSAYEKFVAATADFYDAPKALDVEMLRKSSAEKYKSVEEYSAAFERYYSAGRGDNYYQSVKREITKLFLQFPPYYPLINKYGSSYFVRIDFPGSERFFVLGLLEKDGEVKYICYGLPGEKGQFCDKDFSYVDSLPDGFWMLYQDADTGQITAYNG